MPDSFIDKLKDFLELTACKVEDSTSDISTFHPQRSLREGCASSPILFNIYHQALIRKYQQKKEKSSRLRCREARVKWSWRSKHESTLLHHTTPPHCITTSHHNTTPPHPPPHYTTSSHHHTTLLHKLI